MKVHLNLQSAPNRTTGIGVYTNEIAQNLANYPDLTLSGGINSFRTRSYRMFESYPFPVHISKFPERIMYDRRAVVAPVSYNTMMRDESDVSVFFSNRMPRPRVRGTAVVVIHDVIPLRIPLEIPGIAERYRRQIHDAWQRADAIITVSESSRNDIASALSIDPTAIKIVPNGINLQDFQPLLSNEHRAAVKARYKLPDTFILYFGGTRPYKNVDQIIRAYALLNAKLRESVKLVITRQEPELQRLARAHGLTDHVVFTPPIRGEDKAALYQMAEISVLLSLYEGFGIPVLEAMAAGTPVIISNTSSLPEVGGGAALLVDPRDTEAIAAGMERILDDHDLKRTMIARGTANAGRYEWRDSARKFHEILTSIRN
jgi:glycosyltransferase involved in cell wall biosynthesis